MTWVESLPCENQKRVLPPDPDDILQSQQSQTNLGRSALTSSDSPPLTLLGNRQESVASGSGAHGINGNVDRAIRTVLESNAHRKRTSKLTVDLRLGRASADRTP